MTAITIIDIALFALLFIVPFAWWKYQENKSQEEEKSNTVPSRKSGIVKVIPKKDAIRKHA